MDAEYHRRKKAYFEANADKGISPTLVRYLDCLEQYATGHVVWCLNSYRHNFPGGDGYRSYFAKRVAEGAIFWDNAGQSKNILTGIPGSVFQEIAVGGMDLVESTTALD
ncbi:hypothetical protein N7481_012954 [Penicillium waksmanii]|uniref:uncharacterized protein n=1 Tax=Penicillium waksmanii TaxID=69791 RepID=UPI002548B784|nr:uncharacterized protein N7481_012954 [Penicillium waksmanii]KAJ5966240.1 hypothetical protein N7481_012954 [Penicillium waksmanii]